MSSCAFQEARKLFFIRAVALLCDAGLRRCYAALGFAIARRCYAKLCPRGTEHSRRCAKPLYTLPLLNHAVLSIALLCQAMAALKASCAPLPKHSPA